MLPPRRSPQGSLESCLMENEAEFDLRIVRVPRVQDTDKDPVLRVFAKHVRRDSLLIRLVPGTVIDYAVELVFVYEYHEPQRAVVAECNIVDAEFELEPPISCGLHEKPKLGLRARPPPRSALHTSDVTDKIRLGIGLRRLDVFAEAVDRIAASRR